MRPDECFFTVGVIGYSLLGDLLDASSEYSVHAQSTPKEALGPYNSIYFVNLIPPHLLRCSIFQSYFPSENLHVKDDANMEGIGPLS
jgi:hypothetical protein